MSRDSSDPYEPSDKPSYWQLNSLINPPSSFPLNMTVLNTHTLSWLCVSFFWLLIQLSHPYVQIWNLVVTCTYSVWCVVRPMNGMSLLLIKFYFRGKSVIRIVLLLFCHKNIKNMRWQKKKMFVNMKHNKEMWLTKSSLSLVFWYLTIIFSGSQFDF